MSRILLHIGTHRTGTTSIQRALGDARGHLGPWRFPVGTMLRDQHVELQFASMRAERLTEFARFFDWGLERVGHPLRSCTDPRWPEYVAQLLEPPGDLVLSCEGLSLLRYRDELELLLGMFEGAATSVVTFVRRPRDFLPSYRWSMRWMGLDASDDPESALYMRKDSWLVDYESRIEEWRRALGPAAVRVFSYEQSLQERGSVVPNFFQALDLDAPPDDYHLNARPAS